MLAYTKHVLPHDAFTAYALPKCGLCRGKLSVCLSVTRRYCVKTAEHILKLFPPSDSATILVFSTKPYGNIPTGPPPNGGVECRGYEKVAICDQYLALSRK